MKVLVAMSGGVDSSVAVAMLQKQGHDVVGATMKLWGGESDSGCCSVSDTQDARRVANQLGIAHHVFNFSEDFESNVVDHYVDAHSHGQTPNPCIECNRHLKFDRFLQRAKTLGFDAIATGHHARVVNQDGKFELVRGKDLSKDQSYVLYMLSQEVLSHLLLPIGELTKAQVRELANEFGLKTATKPDSQDVCFISRASGREGFLKQRLDFHPGVVVDQQGQVVSHLEAMELVTLGQRRGLGTGNLAPDQDNRRYAIDVDLKQKRVVLGSKADLMTSHIQVGSLSWIEQKPKDAAEVLIQSSAHGTPIKAKWFSDKDGGRVELSQAAKKVAAGQSVVLYSNEVVLGGGIAV